MIIQLKPKEPMTIIAMQGETPRFAELAFDGRAFSVRVANSLEELEER